MTVTYHIESASFFHSSLTHSTSSIVSLGKHLASLLYGVAQNRAGTIHA